MATTTTEKPPIEQMSLDDIVSQENAFVRDALYAAWTEAREHLDDQTVKLVLVGPDKMRTYNFAVGGKKFYIDHMGRKVRPAIAEQLLSMFGKHGTYFGKDQATMYDELSWAAFEAGNEQRAKALAATLKRQGHWPKGVPDFLHSYLSHVVETPEDEEPETV
jgi:hypothetical protein